VLELDRCGVHRVVLEIEELVGTYQRFASQHQHWGASPPRNCL
jgi:hypothetical protein